MTTAVDTNVIVALWDKDANLILYDRTYRAAFPHLKVVTV